MWIKMSTIKYLTYCLIVCLFVNNFSNAYSEIIILSKCDSKKDGFIKNDYLLNLNKSLMTRNYIYDNKTYKKHVRTDLSTKKKNTIIRFIYQENDKIFTDKIGYPQFYTQLVFEKNNPNIKIKTVINDEPAIKNLSTCKKIEVFDNES
jgi:hypothetical protein